MLVVSLTITVVSPYFSFTQIEEASPDGRMDNS